MTATISASLCICYPCPHPHLPVAATVSSLVLAGPASGLAAV